MFGFWRRLFGDSSGHDSAIPGSEWSLDEANAHVAAVLRELFERHGIAARQDPSGWLVFDGHPYLAAAHLVRADQHPNAVVVQLDVYFQVAMLTTVGLTSKNAILIVEFAKANVEGGIALVQATMAAVRDRLRPILMTSLAFGLGVLPLAIANGAGSGAQRAIGTGVLGGMLVGTLLGLFFIPLFFVVVERVFVRRTMAAGDAAAGGQEQGA